MDLLFRVDVEDIGHFLFDSFDTRHEVKLGGNLFGVLMFLVRGVTIKTFNSEKLETQKTLTGTSQTMAYPYATENTGIKGALTFRYKF